MKVRLKQIGILLLSILFLMALVAGAYGASTKSTFTEKKMKNPDQAIGKNWEVRGGIIKSGGKPQPIKTLKDTADPTLDKQIIEQRSRVPSKELAPVFDKE